MTADNRPAVTETYQAERINLPRASLFREEALPCSSHALGSTWVKSSSCIVFGWTMSGASSVSRSRRLTKRCFRPLPGWIRPNTETPMASFRRRRRP